MGIMGSSTGRSLGKASAVVLGVALCAQMPFRSLLRAAPQQTSGLKILVLEGEDAVNIIDKKTAVKPTVEVRDQNDLPVSGASVVFLIQGGNATTFANGLRQVTLTTNSLGRATVSELNPLSKGAFQIQVRATFQGQAATATIHQANVLTAAEAGSASGSSTSTGSASTTSAGGGLSHAAIIGIVGGAAAGAGIGIAKASGGSSGTSSTPASTPAAQTPAPVPPTPAPVLTANVTATASPNPAPYSGAPIPGPGVCAGSPDTWFYNEVLTETVGVAVHLTHVVDALNGSTLNDVSQDINIAAKGSATLSYAWCFSPPTSRTIQSTWTGTDANGHAITVRGPAVTLSAKPGFALTVPASLQPFVIGGGGARR